jgi:hypothetical protein
MLQEEESFPNLTELVLLKDTWAIIRAQVIVIQKIYVVNKLKKKQWSGSMTFWCGSGSGSADSCI